MQRTPVTVSGARPVLFALAVVALLAFCASETQARLVRNKEPTLGEVHGHRRLLQWKPLISLFKPVTKPSLGNKFTREAITQLAAASEKERCRQSVSCISG